MKVTPNTSLVSRDSSDLASELNEKIDLISLPDDMLMIKEYSLPVVLPVGGTTMAVAPTPSSLQSGLFPSYLPYRRRSLVPPPAPNSGK